MDTKKVVLVTGSSSGFGRLTAETLARKGYTAFASMRDVAGRNAPASVELRALAEREGLALQVVELDVTDDASVERAVAEVIDLAGRIDVVVNNAGLFYVGVTEAFSLEQAKRVFDTNVLGVIRVNRAVLPHMRRQRSGLLVHISAAVVGRLVLPFAGISNAGKFALEALAESYRYELSALGIDSVLVEPGLYPTDLLGKIPGPADEARAQEYGPTAEIPANMLSGFADFLSGPDAPDVQEVADVVATLIATPAGQRPLRTVIAGEEGQNVLRLNEVAEQEQRGVMELFGLDHLMTIPSHA
jgi:NAD(P)-dependent dehydrogenase (short-subunit alcohol dehydrogenase family)